MKAFQQIDAWNPLDHAGEYRQAKKNRLERGAAVPCRVYKTTAAMLEACEFSNATEWQRAVFEARYRLTSIIESEREHLRWNLSEEYWSGDVPF